MTTEKTTKEKETLKKAPVEGRGRFTGKSEAHSGERPKNMRRRRRGGRRGGERQRPEFEQKIISIRRVTRVVRGGRRFSFSVSLVAGDKKGSVGVGVGKAGDTALAIEKALRDAKKKMITVKLTKEGSIAHEVQAKYASSEVDLMPAPGKGVIAGSSVRTVLELAGIKEVGAKLLSRSKNKMNNARAAIKALEALPGTTKKK